MLVFFPPESAESSSILLVHDPLTKAGSAAPSARQKDLNDVAQEFKKFAADAADIKVETITVEKKWHNAIIGRNESGLDAIIGDDKAIVINFGSRTKMVGKELLADDEVRIRGPSKDVERAVEAIRAAAAAAEQDEIESSFVCNVCFDYLHR